MKKPLRVLQVIDSLEPGGSEKMAVQIANNLSTKIELSALVCTRQSGALAEEIASQVVFRNLNKKGTLDFKAFLKLRSFIRKNRINIIHAHSTSYFWGVLIKLCTPKLKLIWHDHYGFRSKTIVFQNIILYILSYAFDCILCVNEALKEWSIQNLNCTSVYYLPNFVSVKTTAKNSARLKLKGSPDDFKIVHVANLRPVKDHLTTLKAINIVIQQGIDITYHIVGQYKIESEYYKSLKSYIEAHQLQKCVFIYGSQTGIASILKQADLGILSSVSEGLPVSLLEYISAGLPVVVTDVGQCKSIVGKYGEIVKPQHENELALAISKTINAKKEAIQNAIKLKMMISKKFTSNKIIDQLIDIYKLSLQNLKGIDC